MERSRKSATADRRQNNVDVADSSKKDRHHLLGPFCSRSRLIGFSPLILLLVLKLLLDAGDTDFEPERNNTRFEDGFDDDVRDFEKHVSDIHGLMKFTYDKVLSPWKMNENATVNVQEDMLGSAIIRVRRRCSCPA
mmetsp:Transcript_21826/g.59789  ORF Transcript_21826/g.59789 Transcript_21826/m.59789 type:complete len:136 (-) Transcript_21826:151-558(-)